MYAHPGSSFFHIHICPCMPPTSSWHINLFQWLDTVGHSGGHWRALWRGHSWISREIPSTCLYLRIYGECIGGVEVAVDDDDKFPTAAAACSASAPSWCWMVFDNGGTSNLASLHQTDQTPKYVLLPILRRLRSCRCCCMLLLPHRCCCWGSSSSNCCCCCPCCCCFPFPTANAPYTAAAPI